ncbi:MAG: hypothetical protein FWE36_08280, partial [Erysipelotrichales bacterium]|nr:hypothetical protein [Erysipelotrichales bacterium]
MKKIFLLALSILTCISITAGIVVFSQTNEEAITPAGVEPTSGEIWQITFVDHQDGIIHNTFVDDGDYIDLPVLINNPIMIGGLLRNFTGWVVPGLARLPQGARVDNITSDMTITANWQDNASALFVDHYDGLGYHDLHGMQYSQSFFLPNIISERPGYDFVGWMVPGQGLMEPGQQAFLTGGMIISAAWNLRTYTVIFMYCDNDEHDRLEGLLTMTGITMPTIVDPTGLNRAFTGWQWTSTSHANSVTTTVFTAIWENTVQLATPVLTRPGAPTARFAFMDAVPNATSYMFRFGLGTWQPLTAYTIDQGVITIDVGALRYPVMGGLTFQVMAISNLPQFLNSEPSNTIDGQYLPPAPAPVIARDGATNVILWDAVDVNHWIGWTPGFVAGFAIYRNNQRIAIVGDQWTTNSSNAPWSFELLPQHLVLGNNRITVVSLIGAPFIHPASPHSNHVDIFVDYTHTVVFMNGATIINTQSGLTSPENAIRPGHWNGGPTANHMLYRWVWVSATAPTNGAVTTTFQAEWRLPASFNAVFWDGGTYIETRTGFANFNDITMPVLPDDAFAVRFFGGWEMDTDATIINSNGVATIVFQAIWNADTFAIIVNFYNEGILFDWSWHSNTLENVLNNLIFPNPNPERLGFRFMGWNLRGIETTNGSYDTLVSFDAIWQVQLNAPVLSRSGNVLNWLTVSGATGYEISVNGGAWLPIIIFSTTGSLIIYDISGHFIPITEQSFRIRAISSDPNFISSEASNTVTYRYLPAPPAPVISRIGSTNNISWDAVYLNFTDGGSVGYATGYRIYRNGILIGTAGPGGFVQNHLGNPEIFNVSDFLVPGNNRITVTAVFQAGFETPWSEESNAIYIYQELTYSVIFLDEYGVEFILWRETGLTAAQFAALVMPNATRGVAHPVTGSFSHNERIQWQWVSTTHANGVTTTTFQANWVFTPITVMFFDNGDEIVPFRQTGLRSVWDMTPIPNLPDSGGMVFIGWDFSNLWNVNNIVDGVIIITVYSMWDTLPITNYHIQFVDGDLYLGQYSHFISDLSEITWPADRERLGYNFLGWEFWFSEVMSIGTLSMIYRAVWEQISATHTVIFTNHDGVTIVTRTGELDPMTVTIQPTVAEMLGFSGPTAAHVLSGWIILSVSGPLENIVTTVFQAVWVLPTYEVRFIDTHTGHDSTLIVNTLNNLNTPDISRTGFSLLGWYEVSRVTVAGVTTVVFNAEWLADSDTGTHTYDIVFMDGSTVLGALGLTNQTASDLAALLLAMPELAEIIGFRHIGWTEIGRTLDNNIVTLTFSANWVTVAHTYTVVFMN